ncbi:MAG: carbohydrate ABC transporter permease [Caldilinea sp.]|nr:carbohydrate ABC transporter permease [Caldilinea sp.]MCB0137781.1 carbohydrate ABC transporter permease [Caldilineaceae bacterium]MCB9114782.1 carbohydrate ABC transporter permease [Caldilineaceae bacterium]MCB9120356.1 carbohydrate ABC transporter permease [Caldilineaceae bacterium]MCO5208602.1 carbohydrate ABC transporter permease [Caldilinea sp.]
MTAANNTLRTPARSEPRMTRRQRTLLQKTAIHLVLLAGVVLMFIPLVWTISTSLKSPGEVYLFPPTWIPNEIMWSNYYRAVTAIPFFLYLWNTVLITAISIVGKVISITLVAFAFARLRWWGRDVMFIVMLATMMLPPHITLIPQFIMFKWLGWIDTFLPLIVPTFFGGPYLTFLVRQYLLAIPRELDDAARIDGCSDFGLYWRIIMPLAKPAILIVVIFVFNGTWNEFLLPLIYLHNPDLFTLALGLRMFQGEASTSWNLLMAASLLSMLPVIILFFVTQRHFIQGIVFTGVKA